MLIAPTEPLQLKALGRVSPYPESVGADYYWFVPGPNKLRCGVQRKEMSDLLSSLGDRLTREIAQMQALDVAVLIVEGGKWTTNGLLLDAYARNFTIDAFRSLQLSIQDRGIKVITTTDMNDTARALRGIERWTRKSRHSTLDTRTKNAPGWGMGNHPDFATFLLQSLPGISAVTARAIYDHFGRLPLAWTVSEKELLKVKGVGPGRVKTIMKALENGRTDSQEASSTS